MLARSDDFARTLPPRQPQEPERHCTNATFGWMNNPHGDDPCKLAKTIWQAGGDSPTVPNAYTCSWAAYNLGSACQSCVGMGIHVSRWLEYMNGICALNYVFASWFPSDIALPAGTEIPFWAATNPSNWTGGIFSVEEAHDYEMANQDKENYVFPLSPPEIATTSSDFPGTQQQAQTSLPPEPNKHPATSSLSNAALIGIPVGICVLLLLVACGLAFCYFRRLGKRVQRLEAEARSTYTANAADGFQLEPAPLPRYSRHGVQQQQQQQSQPLLAGAGSDSGVAADGTRRLETGPPPVGDYKEPRYLED
ncbi:hypothetical protein MKEN_01332600 [Mycena kentingensis (nom. inval.)]|nr:hypothetical protein MKEN_01332600 [Mycena kentingensis (nom. inval.)]